FSVESELRLVHGTIPILNHPTPTEIVLETARELIGDKASILGRPLTVSDDVAEFLTQIPGCYFQLGARPAELEQPTAHHSPFFLCGLSVFAWSMVIWNLGVVPSFLIGVATVLVLRGAASYIKRALVLRDSMADEADAETRTLETNRYIFWRRAFGLLILITLYLGVMGMVFGLGPLAAMLALPALLGQLLFTVAQLGALMLANFALFFG